MENYGMPFVLGTVPRGTYLDEQRQLLDSLDQLVQDAIVIMPNDSQIELLDGGKAGGANVHKERIDQCNSEIALAIVGQTLTSEVGSNGSYAAAKTHNDVRAEIVASDKRMVEQVLQQLVNWVYELNWSTGNPPRFAMWPEEDVDQALAQRDKTLTETGVKFTKSYFVKAYGLSEDDFDLADAPRADQPASFAAPVKETAIAITTDNGATRGLNKLGRAIFAQLVNLVGEGDDFEDLQARVSKLYPAVDTKELTEALARALYVAEINSQQAEQ